MQGLYLCLDLTWKEDAGREISTASYSREVPLCCRHPVSAQQRSCSSRSGLNWVTGKDRAGNGMLKSWGEGIMTHSTLAPSFCTRTSTTRLWKAAPPPASWQPNTKPYPDRDMMEKENIRFMPWDVILAIKIQIYLRADLCYVASSSCTDFLPGSTTSATNSPSSITNSDSTVTLKSEPSATSQYPGQTIVSVSQVRHRGPHPLSAGVDAPCTSIDLGGAWWYWAICWLCWRPVAWWTASDREKWGAWANILQTGKASSLLAPHQLFHLAMGNWEVQALLLQRQLVRNQFWCRAGFSSHLLPWNPGNYNPIELVGSSQGGNLCSSSEMSSRTYIICAL